MKTVTRSELFRELPSVDELLRAPQFAGLFEEHGPTVLTDAIRSVLGDLRDQISSGLLDDAALRLALEELQRAVEARLRAAPMHDETAPAPPW